jgi:hypothetical protein
VLDHEVGGDGHEVSVTQNSKCKAQTMTARVKNDDFTHPRVLRLITTHRGTEARSGWAKIPNPCR